MNINVLDCTLRDGGCVNNFNFGNEDINKIKEQLEKSKVNIIELGYIDSKKGTENDRTQFVSDLAINNFLKNKNRNTLYVAMSDYGTFDFNKLKNRTDDTIDGIRVAFHKRDIDGAIANAKIAIDKGYKVFLQPMVVMKYTNDELLSLIEKVNKFIPDIEAFYIVDSFGYMNNDDIVDKYNIINKNLNINIKVGLHTHNNMQMCYSNALTFIKINNERDIIIDSSVSGMGKGAGNLPTELIMMYLNEKEKLEYNLQPIYDMANGVIANYKKKYNWGYCHEYLLSAIHKCTPSYINYFIKEKELEFNDIQNVLSNMNETEKVAFNKEYANDLLRKCMIDKNN